MPFFSQHVIDNSYGQYFNLVPVVESSLFIPDCETLSKRMGGAVSSCEETPPGPAA